MQVRLITKSEVNIYFYSPGQILRGSNINRLSTANRENVIPVIQNSMLLTDWEIILNIETVDFSETQGGVSEVFRKNKKGGIIIQDDNIT
jgi:hypothetical protein